ncbi:MAG: hypothetical protein ACFB51_21525 [Anaerolineae bacterium]
MENRITAVEWRWVLVASLIVIGLSSVPYVLGLLIETPELRYSGFVIGIQDMHSYLGKMRWGAAHPGFRFELFYTAEPHTGGFVFGPQLFLGKVMGLLSGQGGAVSGRLLWMVYHVWRVAAALLMLFAIYAFAARFVEAVPVRRLAWGIAAVTGGLDWVLVLAGFTPLAFLVPEAFSFLIVFLLPHLAMARALMLVGWLLLLRAVDHSSWQLAALAGLVWVIMGVFVPFFDALLGVLIATWLFGQLIVKRRIPWKPFGLAAIAGALPVVLLLYNAWLFTTDPVFAVWQAQNDLPSPPVFQYLLAYGLLIALAVPGVRRLLQDGLTDDAILLLTWPLAAAAMVYLPVNVQRRLVEGAIVPLAVLSAMGIVEIVRGHRRQLRRAAVAVALFLLVMPNFFLIFGAVQTVSRRAWPVFVPAEVLQAADWIDANVPPYSVFVAEELQSNMLAGYTRVKVFHGHGPETLYLDETREQAQAFFSGEGGIEVLREGGVDYVFWGPQERAFCEGLDCLAGLPLEPVYADETVTIYEVLP